MNQDFSCVLFVSSLGALGLGLVWLIMGALTNEASMQKCQVICKSGGGLMEYYDNGKCECLYPGVKAELK